VYRGNVVHGLRGITDDHFHGISHNELTNSNINYSVYNANLSLTQIIPQTRPICRDDALSPAKENRDWQITYCHPNKLHKPFSHMLQFSNKESNANVMVFIF
jgi:hypothetical protein